MDAFNFDATKGQNSQQREQRLVNNKPVGKYYVTLLGDQEESKPALCYFCLPQEWKKR